MLSINVSHAKPFLSYPYEEVLCPRLERAQREPVSYTHLRAHET